MKQTGRKYRKRIAAVIIVIIVIIFTIILFPRHAVWRQFSEHMDEGIWRQQNTRAYFYEKRLSLAESNKLRAILKETKLYDTRKYAIDRDSGVLNGEMTVNGKVYGVDLTSGLLLSDHEIGWLRDEHISWVKLLCLKPAVPAERGG